MRLNYDCIRDILIAIEETTTFDKGFEFYGNSHNSHLSKYQPEEILYHIKQLNFAGLLHDCKFMYDEDVIINDLSWEGHEFLNNIRNQDTWNKTKNLAKELGINSLKALSQISAKYVTQLVLNNFIQN